MPNTTGIVEIKKSFRTTPLLLNEMIEIFWNIDNGWQLEEEED